jgi:hypothetical protein
MTDQQSGLFVRFCQAVRRAYKAIRADQKSGFDYESYRAVGTLALVWGTAFILLVIVARWLTDWEVDSWSFPLGVVLIWIGYVYRYDLPNIYRRMADLEQRLQKRIDALSAAQGGNGQRSTGEG